MGLCTILSNDIEIKGLEGSFCLGTNSVKHHQKGVHVDFLRVMDTQTELGV